MTRLIGSRCKVCKDLSQAVLISPYISTTQGTFNMCNEFIFIIIRRTPSKKYRIILFGRRLLVLLPEWKHPIPSRTRQLSTLGPMILFMGKVGQCQFMKKSSERMIFSFPNDNHNDTMQLLCFRI